MTGDGQTSHTGGGGKGLLADSPTRSSLALRRGGRGVHAQVKSSPVVVSEPLLALFLPRSVSAK